MTKLSAAFEKSRIADEQYNDYINYVLREGDEFDWDVMADLANRANEANRELLEARDQALNECSCRPDSVNACPVCMAASAERYQDSIPFQVNGKEVTG